MLLWVCWGHSGVYETLAKIQGSASAPLELPGPRGAGRVLGDSCRCWQLVGVLLCLGGHQVQGDPPTAGLSPIGCMLGMLYSI